MEGNKKGSHISLVLSFIIFMVSLIFVYIIASASIMTEDSKKGVLFSIERNALKEIVHDIWVIRLNDISVQPNFCVEVSNPENSSIGGTIAMNDSGPISSQVFQETIRIEGNSGFVKIYYSELFEDENLEGENCVHPEPYSIKKERIIIEPKIKQIISNFSSNYGILKEKLGIPDGNEYNLYFEYNNGSMLGSFGPDPSTNIYLKEIPVEYLSEESRYEHGKLVVKIW
ncbi:hypothetical protein GW922_03400 [Candidatus Pacearchaeota archaeon]|nr:hypothetical protein [Candidatus Pacearchaeota archaeon]